MVRRKNRLGCVGCETAKGQNRMSKGASHLGWMLGRAHTPGGQSHHSLGKQTQVTTSGAVRKHDYLEMPVIPALTQELLKQG